MKGIILAGKGLAQFFDVKRIYFTIALGLVSQIVSGFGASRRWNRNGLL